MPHTVTMTAVVNQRRGRSREVSRAALARRASAERRNTAAHQKSSQVHLRIASSPSATRKRMTKTEPTAPSLPLRGTTAYYDTIPLPPPTLSDRIYDAYSCENMHLAKKLLLELKGVKVTSDSDPRIDAVTDEDFDYCFLPNGRVMYVDNGIDESETEKRMVEAHKKEQQRKKRLERLRRCEMVWEAAERSSSSSMMTKANRYHKHRGQSVASPIVVEELQHHHLPYEFLRPSSLPKPYHNTISPPSSPPPPVSQPHNRPIRVPFKDVIASIRGPLFPYESFEHKHILPTVHARSDSRSQALAGQDFRKRELLNCLLHGICGNTADKAGNKSKGQQQAKDIKLLRPSVQTSSSTSSSAFSRASSWLSFKSGASAASISTAATTPSTSPSPRSKFSIPWLSKAGSSPSPPLDPTSPTPVGHIVNTQHSKLVSVPIDDSPLAVVSSYRRRTSFSTGSVKGRGGGDGVDTGGGAGDSINSDRSIVVPSSSLGVVKQMKKLVDLATAFQSAYMSVAAISVPLDSSYLKETNNRGGVSERQRWDTAYPTYGSGGYGSRIGYTGLNVPAHRMPVGFVPPLPPRKAKTKVKKLVKPSLNDGRKADPKDVFVFLSPPHLPEPSSLDVATSTRDDLRAVYIPLLTPSSPVTAENYRPRTVLPSPLPYTTAFKPLPTLSRSPLRLRTPNDLSPSSPLSPGLVPRVSPPVWRIRPVTNPAALRLKAVENILAANGRPWEAPKVADGSLGGGRERVLGIAVEGMGRSVLGLA